MILTAAIVLIALAAVHIAEERTRNFRRFFNVDWFSGSDNCPVSRAKGLLVDQIGLFLLLALLAVMGASLDARWLLVAVGIIAADLVQHAIFSTVKRRYTPGVATSGLYLLYVVYFFSQKGLRGHVDREWAWTALAAGVIFIAGNYVVARRKVQLGQC